ncbi:hypothetical protein GCM10009424_10340 [Sphingomonas ursincola]
MPLIDTVLRPCTSTRTPQLASHRWQVRAWMLVADSLAMMVSPLSLLGQGYQPPAPLTSHWETGVSVAYVR